MTKSNTLNLLCFIVTGQAPVASGPKRRASHAGNTKPAATAPSAPPGLYGPTNVVRRSSADARAHPVPYYEPAGNAGPTATAVPGPTAVPKPVYAATGGPSHAGPTAIQPTAIPTAAASKPANDGSLGYEAAGATGGTHVGHGPNGPNAARYAGPGDGQPASVQRNVTNRRGTVW